MGTVESGGRSAVAVTIFGLHAPSWTQALGPGGAVWRSLPQVVRVRLAEDPETRPDLEGVDRDVLVPLMERHILERPRGFHVLLPSATAVGILADKKRFAAHLAEHGLADVAPRHHASIEVAPFPFVLKSPCQHSGRDIFIVRSERDRAAARARFGEALAGFAVQDFVDVPVDYCVHCVCVGGRVIRHAAVEFQLPPDRRVRGPGVATAARRVDASARLLGRIEAVLAPLAYGGPCNVDYKIDADGTERILEINPRLGGSLMHPGFVNALRDVLGTILAAAVPDPRDR